MSARWTCCRISELTGKAYMKYDECWYCMPCEADCPTAGRHGEHPLPPALSAPA